jgi:hypothetical protein
MSKEMHFAKKPVCILGMFLTGMIHNTSFARTNILHMKVTKCSAVGNSRAYGQDLLILSQLGL